MSKKIMVEVYKDHPDAIMPKKGRTEGMYVDACYDLFTHENIWIPAHSQVMVDTGLKILIPTGYWIKFHERGGLASKAISVGAGIIDNNYTGNFIVILRNNDPDEDFSIAAGKAIAQFSLEKIREVNFVEISKDMLNRISEARKERGENGFGSSDRIECKVVEKPSGYTTDHHPEEWGPSSDRHLTCSCGDTDPDHILQVLGVPKELIEGGKLYEPINGGPLPLEAPEQIKEIFHHGSRIGGTQYYA